MKAAEKQRLQQARYSRLQNLIWLYKGDLATRLTKTRKLFGKRIIVVDIHTHSNYSDGIATVEANYQSAKHAGFDFMFATDHESIMQKRIVRKWSDASWGQEPGALFHHIGLLCNKRLLRPHGESIRTTFERAKKLAPFVWIPHPAGWYPDMYYTAEQLNALWTLGKSFAIEVINGAHKIVRAYDQFDKKAVVTWDQLLCSGKQITALGASDAHSPDYIGTVWTGVFAKQRTAKSIIKALNMGYCFASESTLLDFSCNGNPMGSSVRKRQGAKLTFHFKVADAAGLNCIRIISQAKVIKELFLKGKTVIDNTWSTALKGKRAYYRLETIASDDRRAFSTPIYTEKVE